MASRLTELSTAIAENSALVDTFLKSKNLPAMSFDEDVPSQFQQDPAYSIPRHAALQACKELQALLQGPVEILRDRNASETACLDALCRFNIITNFPNEQGAVSYEELANRCSMSEPELRRLVRGAMSTYVFKEQQPGFVSHTAASRLLATNPLARQWLQMWAIDLQPAITRAVDAMEKWPGSEEANQSGFNIAYDTQDMFFTHISKFPNRASRFADAMRFVSLAPGFAPEWLRDNYPWEEIGSGTVVDVGGSSGTHSMVIIRKFPNLKCIVQDLPEVVATASSAAPEDVKDRLMFMGHDFFTEQPVKGADVYLFRWILHDWSDKYAAMILRALAPALKEGARVVIQEMILPAPSIVPTLEERKLRSYDMAMRAQGNGKEREEQDWRALIRAADPRFHFQGITKLEGSSLGIIELIWKPKLK